MRKVIFSIFISMALSFTALHAVNGQNYYRYGDIKGKLNKRAIIEIAKSELRRLSIEEKIPSSWKFAPFLDIERIKKGNSWIVSFSNSKVKHKKNQTLYIHTDEKGNVTSNSYTRLLHSKK